jgi:hypothetical protein
MTPEIYVYDNDQSGHRCFLLRVPHRWLQHTRYSAERLIPWVFKFVWTVWTSV